MPQDTEQPRPDDAAREDGLTSLSANSTSDPSPSSLLEPGTTQAQKRRYALGDEPPSKRGVKPYNWAADVKKALVIIWLRTNIRFKDLASAVESLGGPGQLCLRDLLQTVIGTERGSTLTLTKARLQDKEAVDKRSRQQHKAFKKWYNRTRNDSSVQVEPTEPIKLNQSIIPEKTPGDNSLQNRSRAADTEWSFETGYAGTSSGPHFEPATWVAGQPLDTPLLVPNNHSIDKSSSSSVVVELEDDVLHPLKSNVPQKPKKLSTIALANRLEGDDTDGRMQFLIHQFSIASSTESRATGSSSTPSTRHGTFEEAAPRVFDRRRSDSMALTDTTSTPPTSSTKPGSPNENSRSALVTEEYMSYHRHNVSGQGNTRPRFGHIHTSERDSGSWEVSKVTDMSILELLTNSHIDNLPDDKVANIIRSMMEHPDKTQLRVMATATDIRGVSPLHLAVAFGWPRTCGALLDCGADWKAKTSLGTSIYSFARPAQRLAQHDNDTALMASIIRCRDHVECGMKPAVVEKRDASVFAQQDLPSQNASSSRSIDALALKQINVPLEAERHEAPGATHGEDLTPLQGHLIGADAAHSHWGGSLYNAYPEPAVRRELSSSPEPMNPIQARKGLESSVASFPHDDGLSVADSNPYLPLTAAPSYYQHLSRSAPPAGLQLHEDRPTYHDTWNAVASSTPTTIIDRWRVHLDRPTTENREPDQHVDPSEDTFFAAHLGRGLPQVDTFSDQRLFSAENGQRLIYEPGLHGSSQPGFLLLSAPVKYAPSGLQSSSHRANEMGPPSHTAPLHRRWSSTNRDSGYGASFNMSSSDPSPYIQPQPVSAPLMPYAPPTMMEPPHMVLTDVAPPRIEVHCPTCKIQFIIPQAWGVDKHAVLHCVYGCGAFNWYADTH